MNTRELATHPDHGTLHITVTQQNDDGEFVATVAQFPSLSWVAPTETAAITGMTRLLDDVLRDIPGEPGHAFVE